jgi:hypothetical protein
MPQRVLAQVQAKRAEAKFWITLFHGLLAIILGLDWVWSMVVVPHRPEV